jgi:hypothetical protein
LNGRNAQRPAIRRRLGELVNSTPFADLASGPSPPHSSKGLASITGALSKPQRGGAGRLGRQVGVHSPRHISNGLLSHLSSTIAR